MSRGALRHAVAAGRLVRLRRGVYRDAPAWRSTANSPGERHAVEAYAAWLALGRRGWVTGYPAALIGALPVPHGEPRQLGFVLPQRADGRRAYPGVRLRTAGLERADVLLIRGVPATAPAWTSLDVAREHGFPAGLVLADAALRLGITAIDDLRRVANTVAGWPAGSRAALVAEHANGARESPAESISYAAFDDAGLPLPECNAWVIGHGADGVRADFAWRDGRLVGEVDGRVKYSDPLHAHRDAVLVEEKRRQSRLEDAGFVVVRWSAAEAMHQPETVVDRIVRLSRLAAEMYRVPPLEPGRLAR